MNSMEDFVVHLDELLSVFYLDSLEDAVVTPPEVIKKVQGLLLRSNKQLSSLSYQKVTAFLDLLQNQVPEFKGVGVARAHFAYLLVSHLRERELIDVEVTDVLSLLNALLIAQGIQSPAFWAEEHPLKTAYNLYHEALIGWSKEGGPQAQHIFDAFVLSVEKLQAHSSDQAVVNQAIKEFKALVDAENEKIDRLSARVKQAEIGQIKNAVANSAVIAFINEKSRQRQVPDTLLSILSEDLVNELKIDIINQGVESPLWQRYQKLWPHFFSFYKWIDNPERDESKRNEITRFFHNWKKFLLEELPMGERFNEVIVKMEFDLVQSGMGEVANNMVAFPLLEGSLVDPAVEKTVSKQLLEEASAFQEGDWFLVSNDDGTQVRQRLLAVLPEYNHLLFVNFSGQKAASITFDDFACYLSTDKYKPLIVQDVLSALFKETIEPLEQKFEELKQAKREEKKRRELELKRRQEEEERRLAAEKAEREAAELAERQAAEEQRRQMEKLTSDLKRHARLALDSMVLGSWIEFKDGSSEDYKHAKLAVKMLATHKFVFVDEDGNTVFEAVRDDLVDMILKKKLKLSDSDINFSEKLTELIRGVKGS